MICVHCREPMPVGAPRACVNSGDVGGLCEARHVVNCDQRPKPTREDGIQAAEHEVVVALREQRVLNNTETVRADSGEWSPQYAARVAAVERVDAAMAAVDALRSPLPSREELTKYTHDMGNGYHSDLWGAYWLRWQADQHTAGGKHPSPDDLRAWADELECRK